MFEQKLPTYTHKFLDYSNWITIESGHYKFHHTSGSEAERDIELIKTTQETAFKKIILELGVPIPNKKISYYFYPSAVVKKKLMGDKGYAQAIYDEFCIHVLYTLKHKPIGPHEDTHLLTLPWGLSWNFLQEGLAEHMEGRCWDGVSHEAKVREGLAKRFNLKPSSQLTSEDWYNAPEDQAIYYYALAGSWVTFLIGTFGLSSFIMFYKATNRGMDAKAIRNVYKSHFDKNIEELETEWQSRVSPGH